MDQAERMQRLASAAADLVLPGMVIGLGTGSTADAVIRELGARVATGLAITSIATSSRSEALAQSLGIPLTTLNAVERLDLGIDGADEIDPNLNAVKGRGGALLMEKIVALACQRFVLVAATEKDVTQLGLRMPLPVEVVSFGWKQTASRLAALGLSPKLRLTDDASAPYVTDNGGYTLDCDTGAIENATALSAAIKAITGVVDHGLFVDLATDALQVSPDGELIHRTR